MTIDIEDQLTTGMHEYVNGTELSPDLLGEATRRHQRRTVVRRATYAAGVFGLAGALAASVAIGGAGSAAQRSNQIAAPELANVRLAAAATASQSNSYKVKISARVTSGDKNFMESLTGGYDPAAVTGYLNSTVRPKTVSYFDERLVNGKDYFRDPVTKKWIRNGNAINLHYPNDALGLGIGASVDPSQLFDTLRDKKATIIQTGSNTYHFVAARQSDGKDWHIHIAVTGDVTLNSDKQIAMVVYQTSINEQLNAVNSKKDLTVVGSEAAIAEFTDYGMAVTVPEPTQVINK